MIDSYNTDNPEYPWIYKRAGEKLDYSWDLTDDLAEVGGDTVINATITYHEGLTKISEGHNTTTAWIWFTGGTPGEDMWVTFEIDTEGGRKFVRTIYLRILPR